MKPHQDEFDIIKNIQQASLCFDTAHVSIFLIKLICEEQRYV